MYIICAYNYQLDRSVVSSELSYLQLNVTTLVIKLEWKRQKWAIFQLYHGEHQLHSMKMMSVLYNTNTLILLAHWNNSPRVDVSLHLVILCKKIKIQKRKWHGTLYLLRIGSVIVYINLPKFGTPWSHQFFGMRKKKYVLL